MGDGHYWYTAFGVPYSYITAEDIHIAVNILPENKFSLFKWLVSTSTWEKDSALIQKSSDAATQLRKQSFLDLLKSISKVELLEKVDNH